MRTAISTLTVTGPDGIDVTKELVHCCHCGGVIGEGVDMLRARRSGGGDFEWCLDCNAMRHARCVECRPQEKMCENVEAGRSPDDDGTSVKLYFPVAFSKNPPILPR